MKKITLNLFPFLIAVLFIFPIIKESLSSFCVILLCVNTLLYKVAAKDFTLPKPKVLLFAIPLGVILARCLFSVDYAEGAKHVQHALFFFIIPVFFTMIPATFFDRRHVQAYFSVLKYTCLAIAIIYVVGFLMSKPAGSFFIVFQNVSTFRNYVYNEFSLFVIHTTYYTILLVFCSAHALRRVLKEKKYYELIFVLAFLLICFILLTRLTIILLVLSLFVVVLSENSIPKKTRLVFSSSVLILVLLLAAVTPGIKHRFVEIYNSFNKPPVHMQYDSTNIRRAIIDCSISLSKDNFLFGVGYDQLQNKLNDCYAANYDSAFYSSINYMTHDYYFYMLLSSGIFGFLCYLAYLIFIIRTSLRSGLLLFNIFVFSVLIVSFFEDYLYRHHGILYFNLLLMCFIKHIEYNTSQREVSSVGSPS